MRQLTQDESERCHRALGYYIHEYPKAVQIMTSAGWQFEDTRCWMSPQGEPLTSVGNLPERPGYLFAALFERLGAFTSDAPWGIQYSGKRMGKREGDYTAFVGEYTEENDHPCLAICAIIETLEGK